MKVLGNHLLVEAIPQTRSAGGIHFSPGYGQQENVGGPKVFRVLATGPGRPNRKGVLIPLEAEPGDRIICHSYTSGPVDVGPDRHLITSDQILAVLPKKVVDDTQGMR